MWTRLALAVVTLALISAGCASSSSKPHRVHLPHRATNTVAPWVTTEGGRFVDTRSSSPVVLRGVNVSVNSSAIVYDKAAGMGANFVRIMAPWSTVEAQAPDGSKHHWDEAFLQKLDAAVADFKKAGVNVLIDFHQFHWSPYFAKVECKQNVAVCNASGIPGWYYADGRFPDTKRGESDAKKAFWTSEAARSEDAYAAFAAMMAARYADDPNVVGYEVFNEPHPGGLGDSTSATDTMLQWQAEIRRVIRAVDPGRTVFIMCRGGGEGVGTADLKAFGSLDHLALDYHDYFNGIPGIGLTSDGNDWTPSWPATHNQKTAAVRRHGGVAGGRARRPAAQDHRVADPPAHRRMGHPHGRPGWARVPAPDARPLRQQGRLVVALEPRARRRLRPPPGHGNADGRGDAARERPAVYAVTGRARPRRLARSVPARSSSSARSRNRHMSAAYATLATTR